MGHNLDWQDPEAVVTKPVRGVAAHRNPDGDVVIRAQANDPKHAAHDETLVIPADSLDALIERPVAMRDEPVAE